MKRMVREAKKLAGEKWACSLMQDLERNKMMFWNKVKR